MGERLRPLCDLLEGYDISAAMLQKAEAKGIYDRLTKADLQALELPAGAPTWSPRPTSSCMSARWMHRRDAVADGLVARRAVRLLGRAS